MKHSTLIISALFILCISFPAYAFADTSIIQGNTENNTSVTTHIEGSGSVHTHIESTVNGNTKVLDSNQPGTYTLHNSSSGSTSESTSVSITTRPATPTAKPTPKHVKEKFNSAQFVNPMTQIRLFFHTVVQKIFSIFHT